MLGAISRALNASSTAVSDRVMPFGAHELSPKFSPSRNSAISFSRVRNLSSRIEESDEPFADQYSDTEILEEISSDADIDSDSSSVKEPKMPLFKVIVGVQRKESVGDVLDKWISSGNTLVSKDVYNTLSVLKSRRLYTKALEVYNLFFNLNYKLLLFHYIVLQNKCQHHHNSTNYKGKNTQQHLLYHMIVPDLSFGTAAALYCAKFM